MEYTAMGDTINLAARMEQTARPGSIQITEHVYQLVEPWFEFEPLGGIQVKGKSEPVLAYRVLGVKARPGRVRGLEGQGLSSPLVGREQELNAIESCLERLSKSGEGGIVGIIGEAGLGKTRLVAEARAFAFASNANVLWLEGQTLSFGQTISYYPFQQILRGWAGITEDDDADISWSKLEGHVRQLFVQETIDYLPYLASLLALDVRGEYAERVKYLDGEAMGKQIFLTSRRFFDRLARTQPTVLVFEDLHWIDESSTLRLEHLLPLTETAPLLIVGLTRPERDTPAARVRELCARDYAARYIEIRLAPLSDRDSAQLVHNLLEIEDLPARLRDLIVKRAEGNPFFLEEVIRTLIDTRAVTYDTSSGHWRATSQIESVHIPDTIQGVIMARVDRLDEEVKQVLRVASVIGRSFLYRVLKAIAEVGQRLEDDLTELQQSELIREKQDLPELEYIFKHALAQEATYESILLQKRHELHTRVAQAIESLFAERLEEFYGLLAYHYARAEAWEKAQEYLLKAGDQAGRMAADAEALNLYEQAMTAYARAFGDQWDSVQRAALERKMGEALVRRGDHTQARDYLRRGLTYLGRPLPTSRWSERQTILSEVAGQIVLRLLPSLFLKPVTGPASPAVEEETRIYIALEDVAVVADPELFLLVAFRLLNFSEQRGFLSGVVMGASMLGTAADFMGVFGLAGRFHRRAVAQAEQLQHLDAIGLAYQVLTLHEFYLGEWDMALENAQRAATVHREAGNLRGWGWATFFMGCISTYRGDFVRALIHSQNLIQFGQDGADRHVWCLGLYVHGFVQQYKGQLEDAITHQQQAVEMAAAVPDYLTRIGAGARLGQCYLRLGQLKNAFTILESSQRVSLVHKEPHHLATLRNSLAEAYLLATEQSDKPERADFLKKAQSTCHAALKQSQAFRPAKSAAMRLQGTYEWLRGKPIAAQKWWQKSLAEAARMGLKYDVGMIHLEMGHRLGERTHLEKAEAIFAEIGAELDLAKARELLQRHMGR
jgi:tetratricopeptide (TPR) repeat protein